MEQNWVKVYFPLFNHMLFNINQCFRDSSRYSQSSETSSTSDHGNQQSQTTGNKLKKEKKKTVLDCGKVVNYTKYDYLKGIADRRMHSHMPEPDVAKIFKKKDNSNEEVDMTDLEKRLRRLKKGGERESTFKIPKGYVKVSNTVQNDVILISPL